MLDDSIYYVHRCIDIGNNRNQNSRYLSKKCNIDPTKKIRKWLVATLMVGSNTLMVGSNDEKIYSILGMTKKNTLL